MAEAPSEVHRQQSQALHSNLDHLLFSCKAMLTAFTAEGMPRRKLWGSKSLACTGVVMV